jgi:O-antigen ligase
MSDIARRTGPHPVATAAASIVLGAAVGSAIGTTGALIAAASGSLVLAIVATVFARRMSRHPGYLGIEVPAVLILISTLVWRLRDTTSLASQPLDAAGILRLATLGLGGMLGLLAILRGDVRGLVTRLRGSRPLWIYVAYVGVVIVGITASSFPFLTLFRAANLVAMLLVIVGAYQTAGDEGIWRLEKVLLWFMIGHLASVWFWVVVSTHQALRHTTSPFPYRIEGLFPAMSTDRIGEYGVILFFWGIASWIGIGRDRVIRSRRGCAALSAFGAVCLLFAQYRTGYVAILVGLMVLLIVRRKWILIGALAAVGAFAVVASSVFESIIPGPSIASFLLRGQSFRLATKLSGRDALWSAAIPVWKHSPIIGNGLETASRFDVLAGLGRGFTATLHSTWIEALVGTGVLGTILIASCVILVAWRAFGLAFHGGRLVPLLVVGTLIVRSATGTSFEAFSLESMLFLTMAMAVRKRQPYEPPEDRALMTGGDGRIGLDWTRPDPVAAWGPVRESLSGGARRG